MLNLCTWNIRGLNEPSKITKVKKLVSSYNIKLIALLETRVKSSKYQSIMNKFGHSWAWENNYLHCPRGRIWLGWQTNCVTVKVVRCNTQFIQCEVIDQQCVHCFFFTAGYGLHTIDDRKSLWHDLGDISSADRVNGGIVTLAEIKVFSEFVDSYQLYELQSKGHFYSWHKGGDITKTASRIDRCLGNGEWMNVKGDVCSEYLNSSLCDHCPILVKCIPESHGGGRPFRFLNYLVEHDDFLPFVEHCWKEPLSGSGMLLVWEKLKLVKLKLKTVHKQEFQGISIKERNRVNRITELIDDNSNKLVMPAEIQGEVLKFYGQLLGTTANSLPLIDLPTMRAGPTLSNSARLSLCQPVTEREIDLALKGINDNKAPGIDGFNAVFFKKTWGIIKTDVYAAVMDFFANKKMLKQVKCTTVTLVPKVPNPSKVKEFRPIACCTTIYKIISKILTSRLQKVIGSIVSDCQAGLFQEESSQITSYWPLSL
ncbi:uncharacterized protein [Spinacia oleracea]|uniref:Reverse transcriptase domain-containing protein n=1 Tax=Spinacia oleracea TaxID=3562 RepID=A0ABM3QYG7_SPIOL|nr:uncharacterized protein LOC130463350 [Spinacia oleracea]